MRALFEILSLEGGHPSRTLLLELVTLQHQDNVCSGPVF